MDARYFEDWKVGDRRTTWGRTVGDAEISQFVALGGFFEELFISEEYVAKRSLYPKVRSRRSSFPLLRDSSSSPDASTVSVSALVSVDGMTFKRRLFAGDTMGKVTVEATETRPTSRGDRGIVTFRHTVRNQNGEDVMECTVKRMLKGRNYK